MKIKLLLAFVAFVLQVQAYNIRHISSGDGLSASSILSIEQQPDGTMLFGTIDGLNCYDGSKVRPATLHAGQRLYGNLIEHVLNVGDNNTWVLTNYGLNIVTPKGQEVHYYPQFQGLRRIRKNPQGDGFLLTDGKLNYIDKRDGSIHALPLKGVTLANVCDFAVSSKALYLFNRDGIVSYQLSANNNQYSIGKPKMVQRMHLVSAMPDGDTEYLVTNDGQLYSYQMEALTLQHEMSLAHEISRRGFVNEVLQYKESLMIGFGEGGVIKVNRPKGRPAEVIDLGVETGVFCMHKDRLGDIVWIGSDGAGVLMYSDEPLTLRSFASTSLRAGKSFPIRALLKDGEGNLWVGTKGDGLIQVPNFSIYQNPHQLGETVYREQNSGLSSNVVYKLAESKHPWFWISGGDGICYYSQATKSIRPVPAEMHLQQVIDIREKGNELWMATLGSGIVKADISVENGQPRLTNMKRYVLDGGKGSSNYFFCLTCDEQGRWWFGNRGKGLYTFEKGQLKYMAPSQTTNDPSINDVFALQAVGDNLWIGTGMGIFIRNKQGKSHHLTTANGLPNNTIHAFTKGTADEVWATTNGGLVELSPNGTVLKVYGMNSGLDVTEYCDGAAFANGRELFFGGINGFTAIVNDTTVQQQVHELRISFTTLNILGKLQNINDFMQGERDNLTLTLDHTQNSFAVSLATFNYLEEPFYHYLYRLTDDGEWIDNGSSNVISFTQMAEGSHTLYVKAKNMMNGKETAVSQLHIDIKPPYYRTIWAYLIYILLAIALIAIYVRHWYEDQKLHQQMQLTRLQQQHQDELYEEKLKFLTNVVHELNTPLTLIYGPCERIMAYTKADEFVRKYVGKVMQNLGRLNSLIQEVIDLRRVTTGHHEISWRRVDVSAVVGDYANAFTEMAERSGISYEQDIEPGLVWTSDDKALRSIVGNLISNAFKYTKSEGTIKVKLTRQEGGLLFSVYNSGRGIAPEDRERIFDYYTVFDSVEESPNAGQTSRNGIGMAICHNMTKLLGGRIEIDSEVGQYAQFNVYLPEKPLPEGVSDEVVTSAKQTDNMPLAVPQAVSTAKPARPLPKMAGDRTPTILTIDDNQEMLDLLADCLSDYRVLAALNAEQGMAYLKEETPDLIITDIMMPGTDGLDFTQQVKRNKHTMHIPLIILSAKTSEEERIEGLDSGADVYISKPFSINLLQATVLRLLENRNVLREYYNSAASAYVYAGGDLISKEHQSFADEVTKVIDEHLTDTELTPETLAELMSISPRNLYRKFSDANMPTPKDYIKTYRINVAARWLTTTNTTIQEIIYKTGFNTRSQFYTEFRKHFGMTPKEYREQQLRAVHNH